MNSRIYITRVLYTMICSIFLIGGMFYTATPTTSYALDLLPTCNAESCPYTFLARINQLSPEPEYDLAQGGAQRYLVSLYTFGIAAAAGLAVLMVILGGARWASTDAIYAKSEGKDQIKAAVTGLLLALLSYTVLRTLNENLLNVNFTPTPITVNTVGQPAIVPVTGTGGGVGTAMGTFNPDGAYAPTSPPTVFGYRDGNGTVGTEGDNGLGNAKFSPVSGWTYYNGGAHNPSGDPKLYSQGVAVPLSTLENDFGLENAKDGAYEIFVDGRSIGAFPIVDNSQEKLDLTYGLVKRHIDPTITSSNSWSGAGKNITYKPLPNYWLTNIRPSQPMVRDRFESDSPSAGEVDAVLRDNGNFDFK